MEFLNLFIGTGVSLDKKNLFGNSALHHACFCGHYKVVEALVGSGCNIDVTNNEMFLPIHIASSEGKTSCVELLLNLGVSPEIKSGSEGNTCLHLASLAGREDTVQVLLDKSARISAVNDHGDSSLHLACMKNHLSVCKLLLSSGSSILLKNKLGFSPRQLATSRGHIRIVNLMKSAESFGKID
jgi:ankyrin repeat protein